MRLATLLGATLMLAACATQPMPTAVSLASQVPADIEAQLRQIGRVVAPPTTAALYAPLQQREPYPVRVSRDQRYGPDARHLLDVFTSGIGAAPRPVLVFVHGGAFTAGDKRTGDSPFYDNIVLWAVKNGMVGVNMTYRLAPQHQWPSAQQDLAAALTWVWRNIAVHGGDTSRIFLMGHSSGAAHVAQYVGHPQFHSAQTGIAGAIMLSGLFDTTTAERNPPLQSYFGTDAAQYAQRSALPGMLKSATPMFLAYAELDPQDFHNQSEQAYAALCAARKCPAMVKLVGHSHMSEVYAINTADTALTGAILQFVRTAQP